MKKLKFILRIIFTKDFRTLYSETVDRRFLLNRYLDMEEKYSISYRNGKYFLFDNFLPQPYPIVDCFNSEEEAKNYILEEFKKYKVNIMDGYIEEANARIKSIEIAISKL